MTITLSAGTVYAGVNVSKGNPLVALAGSVWELSTVLSGGSATLSSGATGGYLTIDQGGLVQGAGQLAGNTAVFGGLKGLTLGSGSVEIYSGGTASGLTVSGNVGASLLQIQSGGSVTNTVLVSGIETIYAGGSATGDSVQSGGQLFLDGGSASQETVLSGGLFILGGNLSSNLTLISGAVSSTETLSGVSVLSGASIGVFGATVLSGVTLTASSGATVVGAAVAHGGTLTGSATLSGYTTVAGSARGVSVGSGGELVISSGGHTSGVTGDDLSTISVGFGGVAASTVVSSGAQFVDYGSATSTTVTSLGVAAVHSGGVTSGDIISSGGKEYISSAGSAVGAAVLSGGVEYVLASGAARSTTVSGGGSELVSSGGEALGVNLLAGGKLVDNGAVRFGGAGTLAGTLSGSGAVAQTAAGTLLLSGDGAKFGGEAVISGGTIELGASGALGSGYVQFVAPSTGSGVLQIDHADAPKAAGSFANTLSNFASAGEDVDLAGLAFHAGASATLAGSTLTLSDGGNAYSFKLAGNTAASYAVVSDGHGGTLIEAGLAGAAVVAFAQAAAAFAPTNATNVALASAGTSSSLITLGHATGSAGAAHV